MAEPDIQIACRVACHPPPPPRPSLESRGCAARARISLFPAALSLLSLSSFAFVSLMGLLVSDQRPPPDLVTLRPRGCTSNHLHTEGPSLSPLGSLIAFSCKKDDLILALAVEPKGLPSCFRIRIYEHAYNYKTISDLFTQATVKTLAVLVRKGGKTGTLV